MKNITIRQFEISDAEIVSQLLLDSPPSYIRYFHPFDFDPVSIKNILSNARKDKFFGIEVKNELAGSELAGFYMLRGLDEGYHDPMYGVFISNQYSGNRIASLTIKHAECMCFLNNYDRLLLKVNRENIRAKTLYDSLGFVLLREEQSTNSVILSKDLRVSHIK